MNINYKKNQIEPNKDHRFTFPICHGIGCSYGGFLFGFFILKGDYYG